MREAFRIVPGLYWIAGVWMILAWWAQDGRGVYIAYFCLALGTVQLVRNLRRDPNQP